MRAEDVREAESVLGLPPLESLEYSLSISTLALTLFLDGDVAAICGVHPHGKDTDVGVAWLLTGRAVDTRARDFLRASRLVVTLFLEEYPFLVNFIDARYAKALRWAEHLGFTVMPEAIPYGARGDPFHLVTLRRQTWVRQRAH